MLYLEQDRTEQTVQRDEDKVLCYAVLEKEYIKVIEYGIQRRCG